MASKGKNLSKEEQFPISNPEKIKIGIVVSQWNKTITDRLATQLHEPDAS